MRSKELPKLYTEISDWWPVLSTAEDYAEEAEFYQQAILDASAQPPHTLLELGSGGGNNASHLKKRFEMTLVDLATGMLEVSKALNPECEHLSGDMRTIRLGRTFDAVMIHDAIVYMTSQADLRQALETAYLHCKPGGVALFAPDEIRETFKPATRHGGDDRGGRSLRYLQWSWDPDPADEQYVFLMVYVLKTGAERVRTIEDIHHCGLFSQADWARLMTEVGFQVKVLPFEHSELEGDLAPVFLGVRP